MVRSDPERVPRALLARRDLLAGFPLLEMLGAFIHVHDWTEGALGGVVVAAPHQGKSGTPLSRGHDVHTGRLAKQLAEQLGGRCVIANELRTFVDLNKNPLDPQNFMRHLGRFAFRQADKRLKLYYQSQVFATNPSTILEIHGHARGHYDIEVSTGFPLSEHIVQDRALASALEAFKATLITALSNAAVFEDGVPSVGVYPLDTDVRFVAKGTHTFRKIERLRELGVNVTGLHVELSRELRPDPEDRAGDAVGDAMVDAMRRAIVAFQRVLHPTSRFDPKEGLIGDFDLGHGELNLVAEGSFSVRPAPRELVGRPVVGVSSADMERLGASEGEAWRLAADPDFQDSIELQVSEISSVRTGTVAVAKKYREELGVDQGGRVYIARSEPGHRQDAAVGYVSGVDKRLELGEILVGPVLCDEMKGLVGATLLTSVAGNKMEVAASVKDSLPHDRAVVLSPELAFELDVTFGDLVCLVDET